MPDDAFRGGILAAIRIFLAVMLFAGIFGAFRLQMRERRKALAAFRKMQITGDGEAFFVRHASERNLADRSRPFAADSFGVLTVTPRAVTYRAESAEEAPWSVEFLPGHARARVGGPADDERRLLVVLHRRRRQDALLLFRPTPHRLRLLSLDAAGLRRGARPIERKH